MLPKMCGRAATFIIEFSIQFTLAQGFFFSFMKTFLCYFVMRLLHKICEEESVD